MLSAKQVESTCAGRDVVSVVDVEIDDVTEVEALVVVVGAVVDV